MKQALLAGVALLGLAAAQASAQTSGTGDRHDVLGVNRGSGSAQTGSSALGEQGGTARSTGVVGAPAGTPGNYPAQPGANAGANSATDQSARTGGTGQPLPSGAAAERQSNPGNPVATSRTFEPHPVTGVERGQGTSQTGSSALAQREAYRSRRSASGQAAGAQEYRGAGVVDREGRPVGRIADVVGTESAPEVDHVVITTDRFGSAEPQAYLVVTMARLRTAQGTDGEHVLDWDDSAMAGATRYEQRDDTWTPR